MHRKYSADLSFIISLSLLFLILFFGGGELAKLVKANYSYIIGWRPFPTLTLTNINAPTATFTLRATSAYTVTPTNASTLASTFTPATTPPPTNIPTFTPTPTDTPTQIPTFTSTFTPIVTNTPTITPTSTNKFTFTPTPTATPTKTLTFTPTFTPSTTPTPTPVFTLGLILRQTNEEVGTSKTWLLTSNNPITGPFYDYGCLAYGEAFAYSGDKIYHKLTDNPGRRNSVRKALADQLGLDDEMTLKFAEGKELDDKIFTLDLSSNLGPPPKTNAHSTRGDFWIETMPFENSSFTITVTLSDSERDLADPVTFSFEVTETNCSFSPTSEDGKICYYDPFGHPIGCY